MTQLKTALITGAGSGMGQLAARRALDRGWSVAALDINAQGLAALGGSAQLAKLEVDVTDSLAVEQAVKHAESIFGPIESVTHSAAIMPLGLLMDQSAAVTHKIMAINYGGLVNVAKAALPGMVARKHGDFIAFGSMVSHWPIMYMGAYAASKFAVAAFTEVLYHENRDSGVRFACVCPPAVATPLLQQARDTTWPKMFDSAKPVSPEAVLDSIDRALDRGDFWVFTDTMSKVGWYLRRWAPGLLWSRVHQVEGR